MLKSSHASIGLVAVCFQFPGFMCSRKVSFKSRALGSKALIVHSCDDDIGSGWEWMVILGRVVLWVVLYVVHYQEIKKL
jgi:hypothetical protein